MNIRHFSSDVQALARANRSGDSHMLKTASGQLKENTLFERTIGRGKELLSKISGGSYKLEKISYAVGKALIQNRVNAQLRFFSGDKNIKESDNEIKISSNKFLESLLQSDVIFSNPKKAVAFQITGLLLKTENESTITTAFQRLEKVYDDKSSSAKFNAEAKEFDDLRGTDENAVVSEKQITDTEKLGSLAERAHKGGASKDHAYFIAKLALDPTVFNNSEDDNTRYNIAVSTYVYAVDRGILDFGKMKEILPLKKEEADAEGKLQGIRHKLKNIKIRDAVPKAEKNNFAVKKNNIPEINPEIQKLIKEARGAGVPWQFYESYVNLMRSELQDIPMDLKKRAVMNTLLIADMNGITSYGKIKEIFVLKCAEAKAEGELAEIRKKIQNIQQKT